MNEWQPIETAPKDRFILVYMPPNQYSGVRRSDTVFQIFIACWDKYYNAFCVFGTYRERPDEYSDAGIMIVRNPTHWMSLPEPPK